MYMDFHSSNSAHLYGSTAWGNGVDGVIQQTTVKSTDPLQH